MAYFKSDNKDIYYESYGNGEPLILLNGIMMSTESWQIFKESLSKKCKLILIDFLDQGKSDKMENLYTQDAQVEVLESLRKHLKLDNFNLLGISYGGEVALKYTLKYQKNIKSLILSNTTAYTDPQLKQIGDSWIDAAKTHNGKIFFNASIPPVYSKSFFEKNAEWLIKRQGYFEKAFKDEWYEAFIRLVKSAENYDVRDKINEIMVNTLLISADDDGITPLKSQEYIYNKLPNCIWVTLNNCGHASMYEQPLAFATTVLGFVENNEIKF